MNREDLHTRVVVFLFQVAMHVGMVALFGWLFHKVGTAHNLFQPDSSFAYGVSAFVGLVTPTAHQVVMASHCLLTSLDCFVLCFIGS